MTLATLLLALCANPAADRSDAPVILDFTASWCGPCQDMKPAVAQLQKSGYPIKAVDYDTSPLVRRYRVTKVPTFVVVDADGRELDRSSGFQPASEIAGMYREARAKLGQGVEDRKEEEAADEVAPASSRKLPDPWETVVRIRIDNHLGRPQSIEYGSGTIIYSTPDEAIILTCAHIFRIKEARQQYHPKKFPLKITVELSDGQLRRLSRPDAEGASRAGVNMVTNEPMRGEAIDYDFTGDVGLIRIKPGRRLPSTPVVGTDWRPARGMKMTTVGCSEGHDATAWSTLITNPHVGSGAVDGYPGYEAIECQFAPKQGRSGGGLYTAEGRLAGVCDFAEPQGGHGLYATPRTIHKFLDRNRLSVCYAPEVDRINRGGALLAKGESASRVNRADVADTLRAQNPEEPRPKRLTIPSPDDLQIPRIASEDEGREPAGGGQRKRPTWSNVRVASEAGSRGRGERDVERPEPAEMTTTPEVGRDPFEGFGGSDREKTLPAAPRAKPRSASPWKAAKGGR